VHVLPVAQVHKRYRACLARGQRGQRARAAHAGRGDAVCGAAIMDFTGLLAACIAPDNSVRRAAEKHLNQLKAHKDALPMELLKVRPRSRSAAQRRAGACTTARGGSPGASGMWQG
jgi:hypothetical protein